MKGLEVASRLIGEDILEGAVVFSRGEIAGEARGHILIHLLGGLGGGALRGAAEAVKEAVKGDEPPSIPKAYKGVMYMVVGPTKLAVLSAKSGFWRVKPDQLLAVHLRREIVHLRVHGGAVPKINVTLSDGTDYRLECSLAFFAKARRIASIVGKP